MSILPEFFQKLDVLLFLRIELNSQKIYEPKITYIKVS